MSTMRLLRLWIMPAAMLLLAFAAPRPTRADDTPQPEVAAAQPAATQPAADPFEPVRLRINKALVDAKIPSIAVAVARDGKIVWEQGFGWADRENRVPATEHTLYSVASVSKPITATGLMVLVERGVIQLDKPIDDFLGEAKLRARVGNAAEATVRRVANHTSGLPLHYQFFYVDESFRAPTRDETIRRYGNLVTAPGERYQYSNLGYGLLDYIVERKSGKKFADFMREEVFLPLGMTHTSIDIAPGLEPHQAIRYTPGGERIPFYDFDHPGASAVYASAHDLARFAMFHMKEHLADQHPILRDESIDQMQAPTAENPGGAGYGVGWGSNKNKKGYLCVEHSGGMPGVATICQFVPSERLAVVVLANSSTGLPYRLAEMITNIVLPEPKAFAAAPVAEAQPTAEAKSDEKKPDEKKEEAKPEDKKAEEKAPAPAPPPLASLAGVWRGKLVTSQAEFPLTFTIKDSGDVHIKLDRQLVTLLDTPRFIDGVLHGRFVGDIQHADARGRKYQLRVELKQRDEVLNGPITATTEPDRWGSSAVTHWVELKKAK